MCSRTRNHPEPAVAALDPWPLPSPEPSAPPGPAGRLRWRARGASLGLRHMLVAVVAAVLLLSAVGALATRHLLAARVHDYAILNLAGQLRELAHGMALDGRQLLVDRLEPPQPDEWARYRERLATQAAQTERIVESFFQRELAPDLTGLEEPVSCNWDEPSLVQLRATRDAWRAVSARIAPALQPGAPPAVLQAAARVLDAEGPALLASTRTLAGSFKTMMQAKLDRVIALQFASAGAALVLGLLLWGWVRRQVLQPLAGIEAGAARVLAGELGHQTPVDGGSETRQVAEALNRVSTRMQVLFTLAARAGAGLSTDEMLRAVRDTLAPACALDAVLVLRRQGGGDARVWALSRAAVGAPELRPALEGAAPLSTAASSAGALADLDLHARRHGIGSWWAAVLRDDAEEAWIVAFAARVPGAFESPAEALLRAAATLVGLQLERTLSGEALVVAAVEGLAKLAESRDPETGDHLVRMSRYSALIAQALQAVPARGAGIDTRWIEQLERFAPMHDIGKVGIADSILLKPGRLTDEERAEMSRHPLIGAEVLRRCEAPMRSRGRSVFGLGIEIAEAHHERWDGSGYPHGLAGEAIPLSARIVALADVFDALTSRRPYKEAWPVERALEAIRADSGRHFDPECVAALERALPQVLAFYERHKHV
jgi:HD-GYP domain-containing protein (c-di-GMP phosphodiesterase class II)